MTVKIHTGPGGLAEIIKELRAERDYYLAECKELQAEVERLRAAVEAARAMYWDGAHEAFLDALDALDIPSQRLTRDLEAAQQRKCFVCTDWMKQAERAEAENERLKAELQKLVPQPSDGSEMLNAAG